MEYHNYGNHPWNDSDLDQISSRTVQFSYQNPAPVWPGTKEANVLRSNPIALRYTYQVVLLDNRGVGDNRLVNQVYMKNPHGYQTNEGFSKLVIEATRNESSSFRRLREKRSREWLTAGGWGGFGVGLGLFGRVTFQLKIGKSVCGWHSNANEHNCLFVNGAICTTCKTAF